MYIAKRKRRNDTTKNMSKYLNHGFPLLTFDDNPVDAADAADAAEVTESVKALVAVAPFSKRGNEFSATVDIAVRLGLFTIYNILFVLR